MFSKDKIIELFPGCVYVVVWSCLSVYVWTGLQPAVLAGSTVQKGYPHNVGISRDSPLDPDSVLPFSLHSLTHTRSIADTVKRATHHKSPHNLRRSQWGGKIFCQNHRVTWITLCPVSLETPVAHVTRGKYTQIHLKNNSYRFWLLHSLSSYNHKPHVIDQHKVSFLYKLNQFFLF